MGRPRKDAFDEETTVRVLRAAEQAFADVGYSRARLEDIAAAASIRRSSLLYHFGSKEDLYLQVVDRAFEEIALAMARGMDGGTSFEDKVYATVDELLGVAETKGAVLAIVLRAMLSPGSAGHDAVGKRFAKLVDQLEAFVRKAGGRRLPKTLPVRAILMQLVVSHLARSAMGPLGDRLWGGDDATRQVARVLLLGKRR
ncbi:MAG: TetR/AcrR family transcriptional regulator [Deltaproteobacteria bacterium]|jgi:AcrR family transcriptional regulator|nr:TetR/AcrR family transcriptional regulator [Deltaproteobacteria bacterium]MBW2535411.1 TetR/AcrR family transcriptional regulator [Deltaproteobacteria bacterium]